MVNAPLDRGPELIAHPEDIRSLRTTDASSGSLRAAPTEAAAATDGPGVPEGRRCVPQGRCAPAEEYAPRCFIAMPISTPPPLATRYRDDEHFTHVLRYLFTPAVVRAGFTPWPPRMGGGTLIHAEIIRGLREAELVLADLSALNPNVLFELGIRTALDLPVALVRDDKTEHMPFDTSIMNCHRYRSALAAWEIEEDIALLAAHISDSARTSYGRNSLWKYFGGSGGAHARMPRLGFVPGVSPAA
jgi:hypothetical protein